MNSIEQHKALCDKISKKFGDGKFVSRVQISENDLDAIKQSPQLTGTSCNALHEIHIFFGNLWVGCEPDENEIAKYKEVVTMYNEVYEGLSIPTFKRMKSPVLTLNFREVGEITVMQSSLYYLSNSMVEVIEKSHQIAELFEASQFKILREKIEVSVDGVKGIPQTDEEGQKTSKYFEFHIRCERKDSTSNLPLTEEENECLQKISQQLASKLEIPVPLSYNRTKEKNGEGLQRYLNVRFRNMGMLQIEKILNEIKELIFHSSPFVVKKIIREFVWYDTNVAMDKGWIDF
jgi:hypothetical protein